MKAFVYHRPGKRAFEDKPKPTVKEPTEAFDICQSVVTPGGHIANVGVYGKSVELHLEKFWSSNITITTRLVDTVSTPMLLKTVQSGKLQPRQLITHHFALDEITGVRHVRKCRKGKSSQSHSHELAKEAPL